MAQVAIKVSAPLQSVDSLQRKADYTAEWSQLGRAGFSVATFGRCGSPYFLDRLLSTNFCEGLNGLSFRWTQPYQQQGRRIPSLSSEHTRSTCSRRFSGCLTEKTQQIHSLRASGVISSHAVSALESAAKALRKSAGRSCATPPGIFLVIRTLYTGASDAVGMQSHCERRALNFTGNAVTRRWACFSVLGSYVRYACRIMNTAISSTTERKADGVQTSTQNKKGFFRSGLSTALVGACGVGLNLGLIISIYKHSNPGWLVSDITSWDNVSRVGCQRLVSCTQREKLNVGT